MAIQDKLWRFLFSVVCLWLAYLSTTGVAVSKTTVGLVALASIPWSLPWIAELMGTIKVGGFLEVNFRELQKRVEESERAVAAVGAGVGKPPAAQPKSSPGLESNSGASNVSLGGEELSSFADAAPAASEADPNKGKFGSRPEANGLQLQAEVKPFPGSKELFLIHAVMHSIGNKHALPDGSLVQFHLHPTFSPNVVTVRANQGAATLDRAAWGAFTLGAVMGETRLELDLAHDVPDAPALFVQR